MNIKLNQIKENGLCLMLSAVATMCVLYLDVVSISLLHELYDIFRLLCY